jgi:hypothetical protein
MSERALHTSCEHSWLSERTTCQQGRIACGCCTPCPTCQQHLRYLQGRDFLRGGPRVFNSSGTRLPATFTRCNRPQAAGPHARTRNARCTTTYHANAPTIAALMAGYLGTVGVLHHQCGGAGLQRAVHAVLSKARGKDTTPYCTKQRNRQLRTAPVGWSSH